LRAIERALVIEDPELVKLLRGPPAPVPQPRVLARFAWSFFVVSMILLGAGLILDDSALLEGGLCVLAAFPPLILLMGAALRVER
jgi:hypothetical protein